MTRRKITNTAESVRERLKNRARAIGEDFQVSLNGYFAERFLARLSASALRERYVLKGAMLLRVWASQPYRSTLDLDLLRRASLAGASIEQEFRAICSVPVEPDGVEFQTDTMTTSPIRVDQEYEGLRVSLRATLGRARSDLQIDVGTGDAVWPEPTSEKYPALLEMHSPEVLVYPREAVVAEKLHAIVVFGLRTSRIKDFFDLHYLASSSCFEGAVLVESISRTFARRSTDVPRERPEAFVPDFWDEPGREAQVRAFARRSRLDVRLANARDLLRLLDSFLIPPLEALGHGLAFESVWEAGGPWAPKLE